MTGDTLLLDQTAPPPYRNPGTDSFNVIAILSAFNEGDVISPVIEHLVENGVQTYLIDDGSTDDTVEQARHWLGRGLIEIERFRPPSFRHGRSGGKFRWFDILQRKEALAKELKADWFIHHDADEIRESPWPGVSLKDAIHWVDRLGYTAVDFKVLSFPPIDDGFRRGMDPKAYFRFWEESPDFDRVQIKCWKSTVAAVTLAAHGGHEVRFEGRTLFPIQFVLRHYPVRGQTHGERKVFAERKKRFLASERARGWHVQYDSIGSRKHSFLKNPASLHPFDLDRVRLGLMLPESVRRDFEFKLHRHEEEASSLILERDAARRHATNLEQERRNLRQHAANLERERDDHTRHAANLAQERDVLKAHAANLVAERDAAKQDATELAAERDAIKQHASNLSTERDALKQHASNLSTERDALKQHASNLSTERDASKQHASNLSTERDALKQHASNLAAERDAARQHAAHLAEDDRCLREQAARLSHEREDVERQRAHLASELEAWSEQARRVEETRAALQQRASSLAVELEGSRVHARRLGEARESAEHRALELEWQCRDLEMELQLTHQIRGAGAEARGSLTSELSVFKRLLHESEKRVERLQIERERARERAMLAAGIPPAETTPGAGPISVATLPELDPEIGPPLDVTVSVVIPTLNAGNEFYWLLQKLRRQRNIKSLEIVVVDSGSSDGTDVIAAEHGCKVVRLEKDHFSHSFARNLGADHAIGELLLFMVQDAYPIGDYWLYGLVKGLLTPRSEAHRVSALSCAEFPRADSEILYDCLVGTHYEFLGCTNSDRIGRLTGLDNISLRTQGQLSDVTCLIPRALFDKYRYYGRYAEDLLLGVRLIRDGHKLGMVSSLKVIHSHNRPVGYYVRRVFVDVMFLSEVFADFRVPPVRSVVAVLSSAFALADRLRPIPGRTSASLSAELARLIDELRGLELPALVLPLAGRGDFGFRPLGSWIDRILERTHSAPGRPFTAEEAHDLMQMRAAFVDRLDHLKRFVDRVYSSLDDALATELNDAIEKTLAMTVGAMLAFFFLHHTTAPGDGTADTLVELKSLMLADI